MPPTLVGIGNDVHVGDFASLYPSIMISWNISPETKVASGGCSVPTSGVRFATDRVGVLPKALIMLTGERAVAKAAMKVLDSSDPEYRRLSRREKATKIVANSFFGVMGTPYARYFDLEVAESTTQIGAWLIKQTMAAAESRCLEVIYGDTDSLFLRGTDQDGFRTFVENVNTITYPKLLSDLGCTANRITLNHDKSFSRLVFTGSKRYVGISLGASTAEVKGLELKRGDTLRLTRSLQQSVVDLLADGKVEADNYIGLIELAREGVLFGTHVLENIQVTKGITQNLDDYKQRANKVGDDSAQSPHVRVAKTLRDRGQNVSKGTRISYVVTDGTTQPLTVIPADDFVGDYDRHWLWESQVYPATQRLLEAMFPAHDWTLYAKTRPRKQRATKDAQLQALLFAA